MNKIFLFLLISMVTFIFFTISCDNETTSPGDNQFAYTTPQPTPLDPATGIIGTWDCPAPLYETYSFRIIYQDEDSYSVERTTTNEESTSYSVELGSYILEDNTVIRSIEFQGSSTVSIEDAVDNLQPHLNGISNGYYLYVDENMYAENNVAIRKTGNNTILGSWESIHLRLHADVKTITNYEFENDYSYTETIMEEDLSLNDTEIVGQYEGSFTLDNNDITFNLNPALEISTIQATYYLVNNYNTLVLNPCSRVE